ncbi:MAG TPA: DUF308 domain-containing protein [Streptosporangiaceae bacterium]|nr:DUF308 domain-containing protein [Streptosporangiaceae bacterium]
MTDPQTSRPAPGGTPTGVTQDHPATGQHTVPAQGRPAPGESGITTDPRAERRAEAGRAQARMGAAIANIAWPVALLAAIVMIGLGVVLLAWPHATLAVVAILIGAALVVAGVFKLFEGITGAGEGAGMRAADIVIGLLAIVAGLYCLKHHALTVLTVVVVVGVLWVIHGISDLITAATMGKVPGRGLKVLTGVVGLAAGLVILFWPSISLILLLTVLAAWLLFYGLMLAFLSFSLARDSRKLSRAAQPAAA